ncbi:hypothetical protein Sjap_001070 [Stephania japonica]|uniref:GIR1-like zinc ribbon domain-containing protein n=1 Tax=Stephania japonica TaxID=461633 RepID=A0AAP0KK70_9MAGN
MVLDLQQELPQSQVVGFGVGGKSHNTTTLTSFDFDHSSSSTSTSLLTLNLFHSSNQSSSCSFLELEEPSPLPFGWQKFLNLQSGEIYYSKDKKLQGRSSSSSSSSNYISKMSRNERSPKLDLKLNLSPPRLNPQQVEPNRSRVSSTPTSPASSCLSSELNDDSTGLRYSNSPEATSMVLVGCPRCLMYVMLSEDDPKCPKCKSTVLLDFLHDNFAKKNRNN